MKKSLVALAVLSAAAVAQAAPQANTFYIGAKAGWASFHSGIDQIDVKENKGKGYSINRNSVTYGAFAGYQIIDNLAIEVGYDYFGRIRGHEKPSKSRKNKETLRHSAHGTVINLRPSYEILSNLDVYGKVGIALVQNSYKTVELSSRKPTRTSSFRSSLALAGGLEYAITPELALNVEYQWLHNVGKPNSETLTAMGVNKYRPDIGSVSAGLSYRFGQRPAPMPVVEPEIITKNFAFSSDVLFDFGKANLKPAAAASLDAAHDEISKLGLASPSIQVNGYTDRIGKDAPNLALSQRRAETVANYIVSKGVNPTNVTAVGYGKANPVTGNTCDAVKGRKALIACLAPDRRVELQVQGSKEVAM